MSQLALANAGAHFAIMFIAGPIGLVLLFLAIFDPRQCISKLYKQNENSWLSLWGLSWSPKSFRVWVGIMGLGAITFGIAAMFLQVGYGALRIRGGTHP